MGKNIILLGLIFNLAAVVGIFLLKHDYMLIIITVLFSIIGTYLVENIGLPKESILILDYLILIIAVKLTVYFLNRKISFKKIYIPMVVLLICTVISFILNRINISEYLFYLYRDYLRYFIIFLGIINFDLSLDKMIKFIKYLWIIFICNIPFIFIQNEVSKKNWYSKNAGDIRQDYIAGIIGGKGTTELGLIIVIILSILFILYLRKRISFGYFIIACVAFTSVLAIAEIKFAFLLVPIIFAIVLLKKISIKSIVMILLITFMMVTGLNELGKMYPWFENFLNVETMTEYIYTPYAASGLSRGNSFIIANDAIKNSPLTICFGYGISSTNSSDKIKTKSDFQLSNTYNFKVFNISQYIVELGYIGVGSVLSILLSILIYSNYLSKYGKDEFSEVLGEIGTPFIVLVIISTFYNMSMTKSNFAILAWSFMALIAKNYYSKRKI